MRKSQCVHLCQFLVRSDRLRDLPLRKLRYWEDREMKLAEGKQNEREYLDTALAAISTRDAEQARRMVRARVALPAEAIAAMQQTRVGEVPIIKIPH